MAESGGGMSSFMKAALVVLAGMILVGTIIVLAGWMWWKKNQASITRSTVNAREEGIKIGKESSEHECFDLAVSQASKEPKFTQMISNGIFLGACLEASDESDGFCNNVPRDTEFARSIGWRKQKCEELKLDQNICSTLLSVVQRYCHEERTRLGKSK